MSRSRKYESPRREESARQTRLAIRAAARDLFEQQGFAATTINQIARAAGVSAPTVYAVFGSKAGIVREMMDELESLADADEVAGPLLREPDPRRQLALFTQFTRTLFERGAPILRLTRAVRSSEPDAQDMIDIGNRRRLEGCTMLVDGWAAKGALRGGLSAEDAARTLWLLTSGELYFLSIDTFAWSPDEYEAWVRATATTALFG